MTQLFFNNARGVLAESVSTGSTLIKIKDHANIPTSLAIGDYFLLTLFRDTTRYGENIEVVKVTAITAGTNDQLNLTVEREYEFPAQIHTAGTRLEARLTAQSLRDLLSEAKSFTQAEVAALLDAAPGALDTLNELAAALGDDPNFAATMTTELGKKLDKTSYTAADVLAKLLTVDGANSGLDADKLDGKQLATIEQEYTAADQAHVDALNPHPQYTLVEDDSATIDWNFATGKYARDNGERVETTNLGELATVTRPDAKQVFGPNGFHRSAIAGAVARQWNPVTGEAEGVVQENASRNLLKFSEAFEESGWLKMRALVEANATRCPDNTLSSDKLIPTTDDGQHIVQQVATLAPHTAHALSVFAKAGELSKIRLYTGNFAGWDTVTTFDFDLGAGQVISGKGGYKYVGAGWYRLWVTGVAGDGSADTALGISPVNNAGSLNFIGDGKSGLYIWGAQLEKGDKPTSYIPTPTTFESRASTGTYFDSNGVLQTAAIDEPRENHVLVDGEWVSQGLLIEPVAATNKLLWSESFDNAVWAKATGTVATANAIAAPDGTTTATSVEDISTTTDNLVRQSLPSASVAEQVYTASLFVKAGSSNSFTFNSYVETETEYNLVVDISKGTVVSVTSGVAGYSVTPLSNGWYKISMSFVAVASSNTIVVRIWPTNRSNGSATGSVYIWGAQLEEGTQPSSYIKTTDAPVTRAADVGSSVEVERAQDDLTAPLTGEYNPRQGTWVIDAEHNDGAPLTGIGLDGAYTSGKGKLVYSYDENGGEAFANGAKVFDTPPVKKAQTVGLGHQTTGRVQYFPKKLPVAQAIARATGSVAVDYPFADGRSMSFDFVNQDYGTRSLTNAVDVKRSSNLVDLFPEYSRLSPATYWDANGVLRTAGINEPRYDHDPITGEARGFLREGSATNIITINHDLTRLTTAGTSSIAAEPSVIGPDGKTGRVVRVSGADIFNNRIERHHGNAATNPTDIWVSGVLVRAVSGSVDFNVAADDGSGNYSIKRATVGEQWEWIVTDGSEGAGFAASTSLARIWRLYSQTGDLYIAGAQLEEGTRASSFIYTEDAPVTRAADDLGRALGDEYRQGEGTVVIEFQTIGSDTNPVDTPLLLINQVLNGYNEIRVRVSGSDSNIPGHFRAYSRDVNGFIYTPDRSGYMSGVNKAAISHRYNDFLSVAANGLSAIKDTTTGAGVSLEGVTLDSLKIAPGYFTRHIRSLTYYPEAKSDSFLQEITA
jgi:hypothetical protein